VVDGAADWPPIRCARKLRSLVATDEPKDIAIDDTMAGVLSGKRWTGKLRLESFGVDLLEK